jgi:hypothetical protein
MLKLAVSAPGRACLRRPGNLYCLNHFNPFLGPERRAETRSAAGKRPRHFPHAHHGCLLTNATHMIRPMTHSDWRGYLQSGWEARLQRHKDTGARLERQTINAEQVAPMAFQSRATDLSKQKGGCAVLYNPCGTLISQNKAAKRPLHRHCQNTSSSLLLTAYPLMPHSVKEASTLALC